MLWRTITVCIALTLAGLPLSGCKPALSGYLQDPLASPHPSCSPGDHFVAVGTSETDPEGARQRARASVVRQVDSAMSVEVNRKTEVASINGTVSATRTLKQDIQERSLFTRSHLIRDVGGTEMMGGRYYALACLDRPAAARDILDELTPLTEQHHGFVEQAERAHADFEVAGFVVAERSAGRLYERAESLLTEVKVLVGPQSVHSEWAADRKKLEQMASGMRDQLTVGVFAGSKRLTRGQVSELSGTLMDALTSMGLQAVSSRSVCGARPKPTHHLSIEADAECAYGTMGWVCSPILLLALTECDGRSEVVRDEVAHKSFKGQDWRDEKSALEKALGKLGSDSIRPHLARSLSSALPLLD